MSAAPLKRIRAWLNAQSHEHGGVIGFCVLTVAVVVGFLAYSRAIDRIDHQQNVVAHLARETAATTRRLCEEEKLIRNLVLTVALNQPSLDSHLVDAMAAALRRLPERC